MIKLLLLLALPALAGDEKLLPPYPGSADIQNDVVDYARFVIPLGPTKDGKLSKEAALEGRLTKLQYSMPDGRSNLEVFRNLEGALTKAGFQTVFTCAKDACGSQIGLQDSVGYWPSGEYYVAAKKVHQGKDVWVVVDVGSARQKIWVMRPKPMETGKVTVDSKALDAAIEDEGHVAVYGINFETSKADLKADSAPILAEIAGLLKARPALKLYVVGHTDAVGTKESNLRLSRDRAAAVVEALVQRHKIAAARLSPEGVGPLVPLASNGSEDGRARNRRVDLVKR
jgi:outer membrane protein OmpA-like peptidoglycan-associated protein